MVIAAPAQPASRPRSRSRTRADPALPVMTPVRSRPFSSRKSDAGDRGLLSYLSEIGSVDLLEGHEVVDLARLVSKLLEWEQVRLRLIEERDAPKRQKEDQERAGLPARYRSKRPVVPEPIEMDAWAAAVGLRRDVFDRELAEARHAKDRLVSANLRLVVSIAKKYSNNGVSLSDLIQEGSLGLIRGAEKFDHTKGFRFATYVSWWIRQAIQRCISDNSRVIRLPTHVSDMAKKAEKTMRTFERVNNRPPSMYELAEELDVKPDRLAFIMNKAAETDTVSLDIPMYGQSEGKNVCLGDLIETKGATPEEAVSATLLRDDIENVLLMLSPREREVLRMRYGFDDGKSKNFEEIGAMYCVPPNRIRQIEARAIRKLRHPNFNRCLTDWCTS